MNPCLYICYVSADEWKWGRLHCPGDCNIAQIYSTMVCMSCLLVGWHGGIYAYCALAFILIIYTYYALAGRVEEHYVLSAMCLTLIRLAEMCAYGC